MTIPWVEQYRPQTRSDLVGNEIAINGLFVFLNRWKVDQPNPAALLIGPAGCGKTSAVYAIANDLDFEVIEVNASDTRKKNSIKEILGPTALYRNLENLSRKRIILMDEVDGISGRYDRGGLNEFLKVVKSTQVPIVCTANDPESEKIEKLIKKKLFRVFTYERLNEFQIFELLLSITNRIGIEVNELHLEEIAEKSSGDIRAAINELESYVSGNNTVQLEERNKMRTLVDLFNDLYRSSSYSEARQVMYDAPSDYYKLLLFLFDETAKQCKTPKEVFASYDQIARADLVYSRIMKTQNWSLLKYFFDHIGPGIALSRPSKFHQKITELRNIPSSFIKRGQSKRINSVAMKLAPTVAPQLHISENKFVFNEFYTFSKIVLGKNGALIAASLDLDDDQINSLMKIDPRSPLKDNIDEARQLIGSTIIEGGKRKKIEKEFEIDHFLTKFGDSQEIEKSEIPTEKEDSEPQNSQSTLDEYF